MMSISRDLPDKSQAAWRILVAVSMTNIFTYGFSTSFGVFREYYFVTPPYAGSQEVAYVGPIGLGLIQGLAPLFTHICSVRPRWTKLLMWFGATVMVVSSIGAAFATTPLQLIMALGLLYGIGGSCIFAPCLFLIDEWFVERRTLANGIFFSLSSLAPACLSPIFAVTLQKWGSRTTLLGWAIACAALSLLSLSCIRQRQTLPSPAVPGSVSVSRIQSETSRVPLQHRFWARSRFYVLGLSTIAQGLAHFLPALYVPSYAADLGISQAKASLLITSFQLVCMVSQPCYGALVDHIEPLVPLLLTTLVSSASILTCWGLARAYWLLAIFMVLFGASSGAFVVLRSSFATYIVSNTSTSAHSEPEDTKTNRELRTRRESLVSSVLMSLRGAATVASGLIGKRIVAGSAEVPISGAYALGRWRNLVMFTGVTMAVASLGGIGLVRQRERVRKQTAEDGTDSSYIFYTG